MRVLDGVFIDGRGIGDDVGTWLDGSPSHIEGGSLGWNFPLMFIS